MPSTIDYSTSNSQPQQLQHLSPDNNDMAMIVDEAEKLYNKIAKDSINKTVQEFKSTDATASDNKS